MHDNHFTLALPPRLPTARVREAFDRKALRRICELPERAFAKTYDMETVSVAQPAPDDFYCYRDNGSNILAVAHLDTVSPRHERGCRFLDTEGGTVVYSRALDDRLGAYIILDLLPALGLSHDILLTVGEETGRSTASYFEPPKGKDYDWMIEFDRGGSDVVLYQYDDAPTRQLVRECGARVGEGSFSDIFFLEHLEVKGFNWGTGYQDYHGPRSHAYLDDTFGMVAQYLDFDATNAGTYLPHEPTPDDHAWWRRQDDDATDDAHYWDTADWDAYATREGEEHAYGEDEYAQRNKAWR